MGNLLADTVRYAAQKLARRGGGDARVRGILQAAVVREDYLRRVSSYYNNQDGVGDHSWFHVGFYTGGASLFRVRASRYYSYFNNYAIKYYGLVRNNVLGANGLHLQMKDKSINQMFYDWGEKADITGETNFARLQHMVLHLKLRDGEVMLNPVYEDGEMKLQFIDVEMCARGYIDSGKNIYDGVEYDRYKRPVAYYFRGSGPLDDMSGAGLQRIPARDIIRLMDKEFVGQTHGRPTLSATVRNLDLVSDFEKTVLARAKNTAALTGYFETSMEYLQEDRRTDYTSGLAVLNPDEILEKPEGTRFHRVDNTFPVQAFETYEEANLASAAAGGHVSYFTLTSDLEGANYSSLRHGRLEDDLFYAVEQEGMRYVLSMVFEKWAEHYRLFGPSRDVRAAMDRIGRPVWIGPRTPFIDPAKELAAETAGLANLTLSRSEAIWQRGAVPDDVFEQIAEDNRRLKELGIQVKMAAPAGGGKPEPGSEDEDPDDEGDKG